MKTTLKLFSVVFVCAFIAISCSDSDIGAPESSNDERLDYPFYLFSNSGIDDAHGYLGVAVSMNQGTNSTTLYSTTGGFFDNTDLIPPRHNYGTATIAGKNVTAGTEKYYSESGSMSDSDAPIFGSNATWAINGGAGGPSFSDAMYVPSVIELLSPTRTGPSITTLSKSSNITVTWNDDPNNSDVLVVLFYDGALSNDIDPSLPVQDDRTHWITEDDGSFVIPSSALSGLPTNGRINIIVARGAGTNIPGGDGKDYNLYAYSSAQGRFKLTL